MGWNFWDTVLAGAMLPTEFNSSTELVATIPAENRPAGTDVSIVVVNPDPEPTASAPVSIHFD